MCNMAQQQQFCLVLTSLNQHIKSFDCKVLQGMLPLVFEQAADGLSYYANVAESFTIPESVSLYLQQEKIDANVVRLRPLAFYKLFVCDMDSTFITIECIDEIAAATGQKEKVASITEQAMQGQLDFEAALRQRVSLLEGVREEVLEEVYIQKLRLSAGAENLVKAVHKAGGQFILVSGGFTFFTEKLKKRFDLAQAYANILEVSDGVLTGKIQGSVIDANAKRSILQEHRNKMQLEKDQVVAIGDGANDLLMLHEAGVGVAFHAKESVKKQILHQINFGEIDTIVRWCDICSEGSI